MNNINRWLLIAVFGCFLSSISIAELVPLEEDALGEVSGQAIFKVSETPSTTQSDITFTKLEIGLKIEINSSIDRITLGNFYRENGKDCGSDLRSCANNPTSFADPNFAKWACSTGQCGGGVNPNYDPNNPNSVFDDGNGENPFSASALVYSDLLGLAGGDLFAGLLDQPYVDGQPFSNASVFPSGFQYTGGADVQLRDVTMGRVIDNGNNNFSLEDFVIEKPFVEFAYDTSSGAKEIAGLRVGFGSSTGTQGNAIDVVTGFVKPVVTVTPKVDVLGLGTLQATTTFAPYLGGTRTAGYIDPNETTVGNCNGSSILAGIVCGKVGTAPDLAHASPQAQLFPLQNVGLDDSPAFWFSIQSKAITFEPDIVQIDRAYADDTQDPTGYDGDGLPIYPTKTVSGEYQLVYEESQPGVWINLGALGLRDQNGNDIILGKQADGSYTNSINQLSTVSGFSANTLEPRHPDNYFSQNTANNLKYPQSNNYY